jgi:hypothetical protein
VVQQNCSHEVLNVLQQDTGKSSTLKYKQTQVCHEFLRAGFMQVLDVKDEVL